MKYFLFFTVIVILLITLQFIFYRTLPILGSFPLIKSNVVIKPNGEIVLKIIQNGTFEIDHIQLYYNEKIIYSEIMDDFQSGKLKYQSDFSEMNKSYKDRVVFISLPMKIFENKKLQLGMIFKLSCNGYFDQYLAASTKQFEIECIVISEE